VSTDDWLTTEDAAAILDVDPRHVALLCRRGTLAGRRFGRAWQVSRASVEKYQDDPKRKPKPKAT
jgi:excisionase family DNA binding protein